jgi:two-component system NtrC family sensor kinase
VKAPAELSRHPRSAPGRPPRPPETRPGARALLAEDERVVGDLLAEFLTLEGYEVDRVMNGREALELIRRRTYAVIVSDVRMPDMDGAALYAELRTTRPELARRMVFVTGDIVSPETRRFLEETRHRYLEKPFTIGEFQTMVREALREASSPEPPAEPGRR